MTEQVTTWRKSTRSNGQANCVEVAFHGDTALVRDSKYLRDPANDPAQQPIITIARAHWPAFLAAAIGARVSPSISLPTIERTAAGGAVLTDHNGTSLEYNQAEWSAFQAGVRDAEFSAA